MIRGLVRVTRSASERRAAPVAVRGSPPPASGSNGTPARPAPPRPGCPPAGEAPGANRAAGSAPSPRRRRSGPRWRPGAGPTSGEAVGCRDRCAGRRGPRPDVSHQEREGERPMCPVQPGERRLREAARCRCRVESRGTGARRGSWRPGRPKRITTNPSAAVARTSPWPHGVPPGRAGRSQRRRARPGAPPRPGGPAAPWRWPGG